jgi:hypothetical protein
MHRRLWGATRQKIDAWRGEQDIDKIYGCERGCQVEGGEASVIP